MPLACSSPRCKRVCNLLQLAGGGLVARAGTQRLGLRHGIAVNRGAHRPIARHLAAVQHGRHVGAHPVVVTVFAPVLDQCGTSRWPAGGMGPYRQPVAAGAAKTRRHNPPLAARFALRGPPQRRCGAWAILAGHDVVQAFVPPPGPVAPASVDGVYRQHLPITHRRRGVARQTAAGRAG